MTGTQTTLALGLHEIAAAVETGKYGTDDEIDEDGLEALMDDVEELMTQV